jgi:tetratricopeptide (TPR) repeat protein
MPVPSDKIEALERRLAADPRSPLFVSLAEAYRREGRAADAERVLRAGLDRHAEHGSARTALGRLLLETGRFHEAREQLGRALEQAPDNLLARRLLDEAAARARGPEPEAGATLPIGASLDDRALAPARAAGEPPPAEPSPVDELSSVTLAEIYLRQGERERAAEIYRDVLAREPDNREWRERLRALGDVAPPAREPGVEPLPEDVWEAGPAAGLDEPAPVEAAPARSGAEPAAARVGRGARAARIAALERYLARVRAWRRIDAR